MPLWQKAKRKLEEVVKVNVMQKTVTSGGQSFPLYVGFITARDLLKVAEVPNFQPSTSNEEIAKNVLTPPVKKWQRPLIEEKKDRIVSIFNGTGEFMPNPVLIAERCVGDPPGIKLEPQLGAGGIPTGLMEVTINEVPPGKQLPLWIIDGQHRITGLGDPACTQKDNPIPVVLLLNNGGNFYNGRNLAKIFAQVTTEATPLAPLHKEWLTYAFSLDSYSDNNPLKKAMETAALLCQNPLNNITGKPNNFHDDIRFNDVLSSNPKFLGHQYDCKDISTLISRFYYEEVSNFPHLDPQNLANQISMAFEVLKRNVPQPQDKSVFFGKQKHCHKIMCDAYLVGVLAFLRKKMANPTENDWESLLGILRFKGTDWNFHQFVVINSRWVDKSKTLAFDVFNSVFEVGKLPDNVSNIYDYLSGDQLYIDVEFKHLSPNENPIKRDSKSVRFGRGDKKTVPMDKRRYFKVVGRSVNAKHLVIIDEKSSPADPISFRATGEKLCPPKVKYDDKSQDPLSLTIKCILYGGAEESISIKLAGWK